MKSLLRTFVEAIDAEIAFIEKNDRDRSYELISGRKDEKSTGTLYVFILADPLRVPEDASGLLRVGQLEIPAMVAAQEGSRIWLLLESNDPLPDYFPAARLVLNEVELLKKLRDAVIQITLRDGHDLLPKVFGISPSHVARDPVLPSVLQLTGSPDTDRALLQCLASEITFLWGPPGTGKTFSIATLVASLAALGETVLVTSHTHAAVEQALWALIEPPDDERPGGPLHGSDLLSEGKLIKVGPVKSEKIPRSASLDSLLDDRANERQAAISILVAEQQRVSRELQSSEHNLSPWRALRNAEDILNSATHEYENAQHAYADAQERQTNADAAVAANQGELEKARKSFFWGRSGRVVKAQTILNQTRALQSQARLILGHADAALVRARDERSHAQQNIDEARALTDGLESEAEMEHLHCSLLDRRDSLAVEIEALTNEAADDANDIIRNATAVFATLTKLYVDRTVLKDMTWDTVIVDEASMAMPPLLAIAASRARKRVVVVGDMYQLAPVVQSPEDGPAHVLAQDIFLLRGITESVDGDREVPELAKLMNQRRMHPAISSVARELIPAYRDLNDHPSTMHRESPAFLAAIGTNQPLVVVDTADFNPWCGKMPGSLSRFNFLSGQVAVEIASLYAAAIPEPPSKAPPRIGIVTPYAAQRRYLASLIKNLGLDNWIMCGTVHTFQGTECDVIIFDSVLGEPHWTSRLTNPHQIQQVRRDLNVAATRARHQFVFVGDSKWLNQHAKPASAFGRLWQYLSQASLHLDASSLLGPGFRERVALNSSRAQGWGVSAAPRSVALLTETDFYPSFALDLSKAKNRVVLYTPFIGKTRWPLVEPLITALTDRGVQVFLLHKPITDPEWRHGDPTFGKAVFHALKSSGVTLIPISGVHSKTIIIDDHIVYDGSLNWASQTASYEHMWRFISSDMAALVERMLQLEPVLQAFTEDDHSSFCPRCGGRLMVVNQAQQGIQNDSNPMKLGCLNYAEDKESCAGYLRRVDARAPFPSPPVCQHGTTMVLRFAKTGRPWAWHCRHNTCKPIRWVKGDCDVTTRRT
jgi:hypothetical protein